MDSVPDRRFRCSLASILWLMVAVAVILGVQDFLPERFRWLTVAPLGCVTAVIFLQGSLALRETVIGAVSFVLIAPYLISPHFNWLELFQGFFVFISFGAALGSAIHAMRAKRYVLGTTVLTLLLPAFLVVVFALNPKTMFERIDTAL